MIVDARVEAWAALHLAGIAPRTLAQLLRALGSPEAVLAATPRQRRHALSGSDATAVGKPPDPPRLERTLAWLAQPDASLVALDDADYPRPLLEIGDPPPVFYCLGRRALLARPMLAIVGSRNATPQGCADAAAFSAAIAGVGLTVVSGLALGIDAAAHRGALGREGSTVAVVGTGPDRVYPARNRDLAHAIAERGALISEFALETPAQRANFPRRNRLISGLARGVLVVEATLSSGSLITARLAGEQGREVFALPGSIHSPFSKGCHRLIRDGAKLVETAQDILDELRLPLETATARPGSRPAVADPAGRALLDAFGAAPTTVDALVQRTGLAAETVTATLTALELDGRVATLPGGRWQRVE